MKLLVSHNGATQDDMEVGLVPGARIVVETTPGKGVTVTAKADGTLRIEVDVEPDDGPSLSVVPEPAS